MSQLELTRPRPEIVVVTLNRPEKLNALSSTLVEDLHSALDTIRADTAGGWGSVRSSPAQNPRPAWTHRVPGCAGRNASPS